MNKPADTATAPSPSAMVKASASPAAVASTKPGTASEETKKMAAALKDGVYQVKGGYTSPAGPEEIDVKLTLKDGVIADATVVSLATHPGSKKFQGQFVGGFKEKVIGKAIDGLEFGAVAGSSLTPKGFNDAVQKIMKQAQS
jgi:uncharacterized protein with FMN-binding domain